MFNVLNLGQQVSAYDCCVVCLNTEECGVARWSEDQVRAGSAPGGCDGNQGIALFGLAASTEDVVDDYTISNGGCGQWGLWEG
jgi:hypothetical protein